MRLMKKILCFGLVSCIGCVAISCKKTEVIKQEVETPQSNFVTQVYNSFSKSKQSSTINSVDSLFYFQNQSEAGTGITYKWNFGDGSSSEDKSPSHAYKSTGQFIVTLIASRKSIANDTASVTLSVVIGQKDIVINSSTSTSMVDLVEMDDNTFAMIGTGSAKNRVGGSYTYLMRLDKNLKQVSVKTYPTQIQLNVISTCKDGNLIFIGTLTGSPNNNELIKMTPVGEIIWSKKIGNGNYSQVIQTSDGGYMITATVVPDDLFNGIYYNTALIKTDGNGNYLWENVFNTGFKIERTFNTVEDGDGFVVAGIKRKDSFNGVSCSYCDSLGIIKINRQGNVVWKNAVAWGLNTDRFSVVRVSKQANGNFNVIAANANGLYIFSPTGAFLDRKLMAAPGFYNSSLIGGNTVVLQTEQSNGLRAKLAGYTDSGTALWTVTVNSTQTKPNSFGFSSAFSYPVVVKPLANGASIFAANTIIEDDSSNAVSITMVDKNGKVM